jgi:hypothetical protein
MSCLGAAQVDHSADKGEFRPNTKKITLAQHCQTGALCDILRDCHFSAAPWLGVRADGRL